MPAMMDPDNDLAVGAEYSISNANLYFFGWGAMISCICLAGDFAKQANGDEDSPVAMKWILLGATSLVVMGTSSSIYSEVGCKQLKKTDEWDDWEEYCTRANFGIWFGLCSGILALLVAPFKSAPFMCHTLVSLLMLVLWCCAVSFLTFGGGPGTTLGNIYFATWIGFFLALNLFTTSVRYALDERKQQSSEQAPAGADDSPKDEENAVSRENP
jgi:hypothetical protein